jgi:fermentation-respiration switch protein FrsA (DUF1100 family)
LDYAADFKYEAVGVMGFSLGAAVALLEAAENSQIKTVVAVSAPYDFWQIDYNFWKRGMIEDLKLNLGFKGKGKGVWPGNPFSAKIAPIDVVEQISPRPVLFVHGSEDWLINVRHSQKLYKQAKEPKQLEIIEKAGHAEKIFDDYPVQFIKITLDWLSKHL